MHETFNAIFMPISRYIFLYKYALSLKSPILKTKVYNLLAYILLLHNLHEIKIIIKVMFKFKFKYQVENLLFIKPINYNYSVSRS